MDYRGAASLNDDVRKGEEPKMLRTEAIITNQKSQHGERYVSLTAIDKETGESEDFRAYGTNETVEQIRAYLDDLYPGCTIIDKTAE